MLALKYEKQADKLCCMAIVYVTMIPKILKNMKICNSDANRLFSRTRLTKIGKFFVFNLWPSATSA